MLARVHEAAPACYSLAIERRFGAMLSSTTATPNDRPMPIQLLATSMLIPMCSRRDLRCCLHTGCALTRRLRCCTESWRCAHTSCVAAAGAEWRMGLKTERDTCQERPCSCLGDSQEAAARTRDSPAGSRSLGSAASDVQQRGSARAAALQRRRVTLQTLLRRCPTQAAALLTPTTDAALNKRRVA